MSRFTQSFSLTQRLFQRLGFTLQYNPCVRQYNPCVRQYNPCAQLLQPLSTGSSLYEQVLTAVEC